MDGFQLTPTKTRNFSILCSKFIGLSLFSLILLSFTGGTIEKSTDYKFDKKISRQVLENYLDRSMTIQSMLIGRGNFDDNLRMIKNTGAKFIGRAVCQWGDEAEMMKNLEQEKELISKVHQVDPDIILQACIFEIVTQQVN